MVARIVFRRKNSLQESLRAFGEGDRFPCGCAILNATGDHREAQLPNQWQQISTNLNLPN